jgi:hypothetical protein
MAMMKSPLNPHQGNEIYSGNSMKSRLFNDISPLKTESIKMETNKSMSFLKEFKPDKLITTSRTGRPNDTEERKSSYERSALNAGQEETTRHTFVNKLVCYDSQGITVVEINVSSIRKLAEGSFKENKKVRSWEVPNS